MACWNLGVSSGRYLRRALKDQERSIWLVRRLVSTILLISTVP